MIKDRLIGFLEQNARRFEDFVIAQSSTSDITVAEKNLLGQLNQANRRNIRRWAMSMSPA
jgi:hypothetical protein